MKQITLNIPENKYSFILELIKSIPYIQVQKENDIPEFHKKIIDERLKNSENGDLIDWDNANFNLNP